MQNVLRSSRSFRINVKRVSEIKGGGQGSIKKNGEEYFEGKRKEQGIREKNKTNNNEKGFPNHMKVQK